EYNEKCKEIVKQTNYLSRKRIQFVIKAHHRNCLRIKSYNHFCSKLFFFNFASIFPVSLFCIFILLQLTLIFYHFIFVFFTTLTWSLIFFITFISASLTKSIHSSYSLMSHLQ